MPGRWARAGVEALTRPIVSESNPASVLVTWLLFLSSLRLALPGRRTDAEPLLFTWKLFWLLSKLCLRAAAVVAGVGD